MSIPAEILFPRLMIYVCCLFFTLYLIFTASGSSNASEFMNKCWPPLPRIYRTCPHYDISNPAARLQMNNCIPGTKRCIQNCGSDYKIKKAAYDECIRQRNENAKKKFR